MRVYLPKSVRLSESCWDDDMVYLLTHSANFYRIFLATTP